MDPSSHLIMHLTPNTEIEKGITEISRGQGVHVFDTEGNKYIDLAAGIAVVNTGHNHPKIVAAVQAQPKPIKSDQTGILR